MIPLKCYYCNKNVRRKDKKYILHINIGRSHKKKVFCTKKHRDLWCFQVQKNIGKRATTWGIGSYLGRQFFLKKVIPIKENAFIPTSLNKSYFSPHLNNIKKLELIEKDGRLVLRVIRNKAKT